MDDFWGVAADDRRPVPAASKRLARIAGLLVGVPILIFSCLSLLPIGFVGANDFFNSGSATGSGAVDRAAPFLTNIETRLWRWSATNARAEWTAHDSHGDNSEYFAFDLPISDIAPFEEAVRNVWSRSPLYAGPEQVKSMPNTIGEPAWIREPLQDGVLYQRGFDTIGVSRNTGRVLLRHFGT